MLGLVHGEGVCCIVRRTVVRVYTSTIHVRRTTHIEKRSYQIPFSDVGGLHISSKYMVEN